MQRSLGGVAPVAIVIQPRIACKDREWLAWIVERCKACKASVMSRKDSREFKKKESHVFKKDSHVFKKDSREFRKESGEFGDGILDFEHLSVNLSMVLGIQKRK